jgi:hypothetical protein
MSDATAAVPKGWDKVEGDNVPLSIADAIDAAMAGVESSKRTKKKGKPFFVIQRTIPADATLRNGNPHPNAGQIVKRGAVMIGNGGKGRWFKTGTLKDNGMIKHARNGSFVPEDRLGEWELVS